MSSDLMVVLFWVMFFSALFGIFTFRICDLFKDRSDPPPPKGRGEGTD